MIGVYVACQWSCVSTICLSYTSVHKSCKHICVLHAVLTPPTIQHIVLSSTILHAMTSHRVCACACVFVHEGYEAWTTAFSIAPFSSLFPLYVSQSGDLLLVEYCSLFSSSDRRERTFFFFKQQPFLKKGGGEAAQALNMYTIKFWHSS